MTLDDIARVIANAGETLSKIVVARMTVGPSQVGWVALVETDSFPIVVEVQRHDALGYQQAVDQAHARWAASLRSVALGSVRQ